MTIRDFTKLLTPIWVIMLVVSTALAQQPVVQPAQGQSHEQTQQDMADCQAIAKQSTGYDPAQAATQATPPASRPARQPLCPCSVIAPGTVSSVPPVNSILSGPGAKRYTPPEFFPYHGLPLVLPKFLKSSKILGL